MSEAKDSKRKTPPLLDNPLLLLLRQQNEANGLRIGELEKRLKELEHDRASDAEQVRALREENDELRARLDRMQTDLAELGLVSRS